MLLLTIGVLGGMGPAATNDLCSLITRLTPAQFDQEHIPVLCFNNCRIPDRTGAILYGGPSPLPEMLKTAQVLQSAGADFLVIPCNTAHHYHGELCEQLTIPVLHMIALSARAARKKGPGAKKVGLLATSGAVAAKIYVDPYEREGFEIVVPTAEDQEALVMGAIYGAEGIKAGYFQKPAELLREAGEKLVLQGAGLIIAGCTEIPLALKPEMLTVPLINPTEELARAAVARAMATTHGD